MKVTKSVTSKRFPHGPQDRTNPRGPVIGYGSTEKRGDTGGLSVTHHVRCIMVQRYNGAEVPSDLKDESFTYRSQKTGYVRRTFLCCCLITVKFAVRLCPSVYPMPLHTPITFWSTIVLSVSDSKHHPVLGLHPSIRSISPCSYPAPILVKKGIKTDVSTSLLFLLSTIGDCKRYHGDIYGSWIPFFAHTL